MTDSATYQAMASADLVDVIINRVSVLNQILGCRYDFQKGNPVQLFSRRGMLTVLVCGAEYGATKVNDTAGLVALLSTLDSLKRGLWLMSRGGMSISCLQ